MTSNIQRIGIICTADGHFYGTSVLTDDLPASIAAEAKKWDGGNYAYVAEGDAFRAYLLPDDWNASEHEDGQDRKTIDLVKSFPFVGSCGTINLQDADEKDEG